ncbi:MAG TPA: ATPase, T2SS/T4P/T4SS family [Pyrinomonadaceae bacterium]|nr:ATPase, T2SS/T4P/T4SS family [Pyrinomonadaceae bacterium]
MSEHIILIYTLSKESQKKIETFRREHAEKLTDEAKSYLSALQEFFKRGSRKRAETAFGDNVNYLKDSLLAPELHEKFDACAIHLDEHRALKHPIPRHSDDFTFYLSDKSQIAALLSLMRSERTHLPQSPGAGGHAPPGKQGAKQSGETDPQNAHLRRLVHRLNAEQQLNEERRFSYDRELWLWDARRKKAARGRALACRCDRGRQWSVTFRLTQQWPRERRKAVFLNKVEEVSELLGTIIFKPGAAEEHGLIVITGRTAACKSQIAYKLIEGGLKKSTAGKKRAASSKKQASPCKHIPTFEDPIERDFNIPEALYTPREKGKDVSGLEEAIQNALRQKPAVLFVGETRDPVEWRMLVNFAGTGHLVVTTAHAGSLVEAMGNILQAVEADEPAARSIVGERLLAVIHLKPETIVGEKGAKVGILIPTVWHRTPEGIKALMAEGLSSLVPNTPRSLVRDARKKLPSSIGRYWFARELLEKTDGATWKVLGERAIEKIKTDALEWDLEGV